MTPLYKKFLYKKTYCLFNPGIFAITVLFGGFLLSQNVLAIRNKDTVQYQQKLNTLQKSIAKVQQHLNGSRKHRSHVITELYRLERRIKQNTRTIKTLNARFLTISTHRKKLEAELKQLNKQLVSQKRLLTKQIRSAYTMGSQQQLKMLLNQQNPAEAGRTQAYFSYLNRAREHQIQSFLHTIQQKRSTKKALHQAMLAQHSILVKQKNKVMLRQIQRLQRKKLIVRLNNRIRNQESTLSNLESSRIRIENLLNSLGKLLADIPANPSAEKPFKLQKGKLPWPLHGPFLARFGQSKNHGRLRWKGVLIGAREGSPVHAISHGRVAFADWLQGFGYITIIDHGNGYMSLYGQSGQLLKQVGDWVKSGEVIATAGDSGGQPRSGVYFEIRAHGKPVNPAKWCTTPISH